MRVALLDPMPVRRGAVNKDISGGFGTVSDYGRGIVPRLLTWLKRHGVRYPVLSLGYAAAIFDRAGWEVTVARTAEGARGADLALVYTSLVAHRAELEAADRARRMGVRVGFFGPFAAVSPATFAEHGDFVVAGEPEAALERAANGEDLHGVVVAEPVQDLDRLPFPAWQHFDPSAFRYRPYFPWGGGFYPVLASRGCALSCAYYCPYTAVTGRKWRKRSPENVLEELRRLTRDHGARRVLFRDPIFTLDRKRTEEIARGIRDAGLGLEWVCETHLDYVDEDLLDLMASAGLRSIKVGIESPDRGTLNAVHRRQPKEERIRRLLAHCDRRGIAVTAFYILGLPADTGESAERTIEYAISLGTIGAQFTVATPYPGTEFYEDVKREGRLLTEDWEQYDIYTPVLRHDRLSPDDVLRLKARAYRRYYLRRAWLARFVAHHWRRPRALAAA